MLEWDILNYLKKWRTNLRATHRYKINEEYLGACIKSHSYNTLIR